MAPLSWRRLLSAALAAALLTARAFAANVEGPRAGIAAPVAVYPAPQAWSAQLPRLGALTGVPGLSAQSSPQSLAPIAYELSHSLAITPEHFAAMPENDRVAAVHLAVESARQELMQKSYALIGEAKGLVWSKDGLTKAELDAIYPVAAQLREIDRNYGPLLGADERELVAASAAQAAAAWRDARAAYVARFGEATKAALQTGKEGAADSIKVSGALARRPKPLNPSTNARKLVERMRATKSGWGESDLETVYLGYGFAFRDGAKHRMYFHPDFKQLHTTVSRQRDLPPGYAQEALKLIGELEALSAPAGLPQQGAAAKAEDEELPPPIEYASAGKTEAAEEDAQPESGAKRAESSKRSQKARTPATIAAVTLSAPLDAAPAAPAEASKPVRLERATPAAVAPAKQEPPAPPAVASNKFSQAKFEPAQVEPAPQKKKLPWYQRFWSRD